MSNKASFEPFDLGSQNCVTVPVDTITVEISSANMLGNYAKAFVREAYRVNENLAIRENLTEEELVSYANYLLYQRVLCVRDECHEFRRLKSLYIPSYLQHALAMVGEYYDREQAFKFVPTCEPSTLTYDQAKIISDKIGAFMDDMQILQDAMPRDKTGDPDVMTTAIIADYVHSMKRVGHVSATYVTALLGLKLRDEIMWKSHYRKVYDHLTFIENALFSYRGIFR